MIAARDDNQRGFRASNNPIRRLTERMISASICPTNGAVCIIHPRTLQILDGIANTLARNAASLDLGGPVCDFVSDTTLFLDDRSPCRSVRNVAPASRRRVFQ